MVRPLCTHQKRQRVPSNKSFDFKTLHHKSVIHTRRIKKKERSAVRILALKTFLPAFRTSFSWKRSLNTSAVLSFFTSNRRWISAEPRILPQSQGFRWNLTFKSHFTFIIFLNRDFKRSIFWHYLPRRQMRIKSWWFFFFIWLQTKYKDFGCSATSTLNSWTVEWRTFCFAAFSTKTTPKKSIQAACSLCQQG